ncbi:hypothetical protein M3223_21740 [Paenibacillus pasadenensis]|uniref:hypothetical protein n=1 Tax=Paenibacillus pasadenensis TaxID=217090 RepID=UPI00203FF01A|nr:hypothetical protein [Paenibacillus pasadenensis]MCM3749962.1 hypothetical protein [Paenibacillus pasadenensis]
MAQAGREKSSIRPFPITLILFVILFISMRYLVPESCGMDERCYEAGIALTQGFDIINRSSIPFFISVITDANKLDYPSSWLAPGGTHHFELQVIPLETTSASVSYYSVPAASLSFTLENRSEFFRWYNPFITNISTIGPIRVLELSGKTKLSIYNA